MRATSHMKQTRRGNRLGARPSWPEQVQRSTAGRNHGVAEEEMRGQTRLSRNSVGQAARNRGAETKWVFSVKARDARGLFNDGSEPTDHGEGGRGGAERGTMLQKRRCQVQEWKLWAEVQAQGRGPFLLDSRLRG